MLLLLLLLSLPAPLLQLLLLLLLFRSTCGSDSGWDERIAHWTRLARPALLASRNGRD
jgi:hypothetical protein